MPATTYIVLSRDGWEDRFRARFGDEGSTHELSNDEVVAIVEELGRIEIHSTGFTYEFQAYDGRRVRYGSGQAGESNITDVPPGVKVIEFHNGYD